MAAAATGFCVYNGRSSCMACAPFLGGRVGRWPGFTAILDVTVERRARLWHLDGVYYFAEDGDSSLRERRTPRRRIVVAHDGRTALTRPWR